jgi:hypothetical protein
MDYQERQGQQVALPFLFAADKHTPPTVQTSEGS